MTPLERRCRLLLRAWPWRDRWERGEELLGTMLDVSDADRSWPSAGLAVDMIVGGIRARRRRRPPLGVRIQYCYRSPIDYRWHEWMLDQLLAPGWRRRLTFVNVRYIVAYITVMTLIGSPEPPSPLLATLTVGLLALMLIAGFVFAGRDRARILRKNGYALVGSPPQLVSRLVWVEERQRVANVRLVPVMAVASGPLFLAGRALAVFLLSPTGRLDFPYHQPLVIAWIVVLFFTTWGWTGVRRVPAGAAGPPTTWSVRRPFPLALVSVAVEVIVLLVWPMGPVGLAGGALGVVPTLATFVLLLEERRVGRSLGFWDAFPQLGPRTVARIGMPSWPDGGGPWAEGESRTVTG